MNLCTSWRALAKHWSIVTVCTYSARRMQTLPVGPRCGFWWQRWPTGNDVEGKFEVCSQSRAGHAVDVLVHTPSKLLEMAWGSGWDKEFAKGKEDRQQKWVVGQPQVDLCNVEWVVVNEADILFSMHAPTHHSLEHFLMHGADPTVQSPHSNTPSWSTTSQMTPLNYHSTLSSLLQ